MDIMKLITPQLRRLWWNIT